MKKVMIITLTCVLILISGVVFVLLSDGKAFYEPNNEIADNDVNQAFDLLNNSLNQGRYTYFEYLNQSKVQYGNVAIISEANSSEELLYENEVSYNVEVLQEGYYEFNYNYLVDANILNNVTISVLIDGKVPFDESRTIDLPLYWMDESKEFVLDSYGDEALPSQVRKNGWYQTDLYNNLYYTAEPLLYYLSKGQHTIQIKNVSSSSFIPGQLILNQPKKLPAYEEYNTTNNKMSNIEVTVNAIDYNSKNSSYIRLFSYESPTASPYDAVDKKLNIIAGSSWEDPGKSISYEIDVPESGRYKLALHVFPGKEDYDVFRTIRINGVIPFEELKAYAFEDTKGLSFNYETLGGETPYEIYFEKGLNEITFIADYEPISKDVRMLQLVIDHINQYSLDIRKITGKEVDKNRTWKLTDYLPKTKDYLEAYELLIQSVVTNTEQYSQQGSDASLLSNLQKSLVKLDKMLEKPDELPLYFEDLYSGSGSINQMLGDTIETLTEQPLSLNEFTLYTNDLDKNSNASWLSKRLGSLKKFVSSFTSDKYLVRNDPEVLNVWVNRPITHVDTLQKLVDAQFTPNTGIEVKISVMPDANKLVLASAGGEAPDVAMGLLSYMPFDLAIRGAAYDLTQFDDFWTVADRFTPGAFVPYVLEDNVYALPETLEFYTTVYRKDIFSSLNLEVPNTWQEVTELLPELQRYGMNYYHQIAGGGSLKWFYQTSPFIYQNGGSLYTEDGLRASIDQPEAVKGLDFLSKLFTMYSLPEQEPLFYNSFRYGTLPIGIADFVTYMQIKNAAPELVGQWALAPYPGTVDESGEINRWYIANGRGSVVLGDTEKPDESWEFLKWWTSEEVQTTYSYTLQSIYGPEYLWLSANLEAVKNSPIDIEDKVVILDQIKWLRDVPRTPGQYMLERGLSDIWNKTVFDGVPTRIAIDRQLITINREIKRKMTEFGYLDEEGNVLKPYVIRDLDWIVDQIETRGKSDE